MAWQFDAYPFLLYRNYDGQGGQYGNVWVKSVSSDPTQLSIFSAVRTSDKALTLVVVNKTATDLTMTVQLSHFIHPAETAQLYNYSANNLTQIVRGNDVPITAKGAVAKNMTATFPALSATIVVLKHSK